MLSKLCEVERGHRVLLLPSEQSRPASAACSWSEAKRPGCFHTQIKSRHQPNTPGLSVLSGLRTFSRRGDPGRPCPPAGPGGGVGGVSLGPAAPRSGEQTWVQDRATGRRVLGLKLAFPVALGRHRPFEKQGCWRRASCLRSIRALVASAW